MSGTTTVRTVEELADALLLRGGWQWAWNGGRYDFLAVLDVFHRRGLRVVCHTSGSSITRVVVGGLTLVDAYYLCPMSLYRAAGIVGEPGVALSLECVCGDDCDGYCRIQTGMSAKTRAVVEAYCAAQTEQMYRILARLTEHAAAEGYELRGTIGGTAWATAKAWLGLPDSEMRSSTWTRLASARYGGRVCVGRARAQRAWSWDITACYPGAMARTPMPIGEPYELGRREARTAYINDRPGVYRATVHVDDCYLPPLPWRFRGRIAYPTGQLTGAWTAVELNAAEGMGATVLDIHGAVVFADEAPIFGDLMRAWFDVRARVGKTSALGEWQRLLCNSLSGKLGEGPEREMVLLHPKKVTICNPDTRQSRRAGCTRSRCTRRCGAYGMLDRWGTIWSAPYYRAAESGHIQWAAYTTAAARVQWLRGARAVGDDFVYGDTDSVWRMAPVPELDGNQAVLDTHASWAAAAPGEVGEDMGQWGFREDAWSWHALAPKSYRYDTEQGAVVKAAGVSHATDREWLALSGQHQDLLDGRGVLSLKQAALTDSGLFQRRYQPVPTRHAEGWFGDRLLKADGRTYPVSREEIQERFREQAGRRFHGGGPLPEGDRAASTGARHLHPQEAQDRGPCQ